MGEWGGGFLSISYTFLVHGDTLLSAKKSKNAWDGGGGGGGGGVLSICDTC